MQPFEWIAFRKVDGTSDNPKFEFYKETPGLLMARNAKDARDRALVSLSEDWQQSENRYVEVRPFHGS